MYEIRTIIDTNTGNYTQFDIEADAIDVIGNVILLFLDTNLMFAIPVNQVLYIKKKV